MSARLRSSLLAVLLIATLALSLAPASASTRTLNLSPVFDAFAPQLITVHTPTRADKARLNAMDLDLTEHAGHDYIEMVAYSQDELDLLVAHGFTWDVRIADLLARQVERIEADQAFAAANAVTNLPSGRNSYRDLADFASEISTLVSENPDIAKQISIGQSVEGRDLLGIEIGADVNAPEDGRPVFLVFGVHHAREWPSAELPMEFAHDLITNYGTDARITGLLDRGRVIIVPVSNPDGYNASRVNGDIIDFNIIDGGGTASILATPGNAYKRKNCRYVNGNDTQDGMSCVAIPSNGGLGLGTDLNRNYGGLWGGPGASAENTAATYRGPAPFSEPETQAIRNLISTRQVTTLITNHTFSNLILRPVGVNPATIGPDGNPVGFAPDECFTRADGADYGMQALGERMSAQVGYSNQFGWELYDTTGTTEDYSYNATGGYGYTFEIGPDEFHPPYEDVINEYTGETAAAQGVTLRADGNPEAATAFPDRAGEQDGTAITSDAGDSCSTDPVDHSAGLGGGMREAYLIAFENAIDARTHATLTGTAPAGTEVTVERSGTFPLWDKSQFADTVTTTMTVGHSGEFTYHVNPSTRPFVDSRKASQLGAPVTEVITTGSTRPFSSTTVPFVVGEDVDLIRATVGTAIPVDGQAVTYNEMHIRLLSPSGAEIASATEFGPTNSFLHAPTGGLAAGTYTLRITNSIAATQNWNLEAVAQNILAPFTERTDEFWTVTCGGVSAQVLVDRGESIDLGTLCNS